MSFMEAVRKCFSNYANFQGRAKRSEFWWFYLFTALAGFVLYMIGFLLVAVGAAIGDNALGTIIGLIGTLWYVATFIAIIALYIPLLAVGCRRLHDRNQSGWLLLLLLVPCANIVLLVFWALEGTPGDNAYGPQPE